MTFDTAAYQATTPQISSTPQNYTQQDLFTSQAAFVGRQLPRGADFRISKVKGRDDLVFWQLTINSTEGGLNRTYGDFHSDFDRISSSTLDSRFERTLILNQLMSTAATPDPTGNLVRLSHANIFGALIMAAGSGANVSAINETSATDPTPAAITYSPPAAITCLSPIVQNGATSAQELLVGFTGANSPVTVTDATFSAGTTGHNNLRPLWDHCQTDLNSRTNVFMANGSYYTLPCTSAISAAPTLALASVPNGGFFLQGGGSKGMFQLGGGRRRIYAWWPDADNTSGGVLFGSEKLGRIVHANQECTDPQTLDFPLKGIAEAILIPAYSAIAAHDGQQLIVHRGDGRSPLKVFYDREPDTDKEYRIRNMWYPPGNELYYEVNQRASTSGTGNTKVWRESVNLDTGAIHQISASTTMTSTGSLGILAGTAAPYSNQTQFCYSYVDGSWRYQFAPTYGSNPYTASNQSSGSGASTGTAMASSGTLKTPYFELPGLEGWQKVVTGIGWTDTGSSDNVLTVALNSGINSSAGLIHSFSQSQQGIYQFRGFPGNKDIFYQLQIVFTIVQAASAYKTLNALPFHVEGYAHRDLAEAAKLIPDMNWFGPGR